MIDYTPNGNVKFLFWAAVGMAAFAFVWLWLFE